MPTLMWYNDEFWSVQSSSRLMFQGQSSLKQNNNVFGIPFLFNKCECKNMRQRERSIVNDIKMKNDLARHKCQKKMQVMQDNST